MRLACSCFVRYIGGSEAVEDERAVVPQLTGNSIVDAGTNQPMAVALSEVVDVGGGCISGIEIRKTNSSQHTDGVGSPRQNSDACARRPSAGRAECGAAVTFRKTNSHRDRRVWRPNYISQNELPSRPPRVAPKLHFAKRTPCPHRSVLRPSTIWQNELPPSRMGVAPKHHFEKRTGWRKRRTATRESPGGNCFYLYFSI